MTMLMSLYPAAGILFAADSQVTVGGAATRAIKPQQKVLKVPGVGLGDGLLGYFGLAQVGGQPLTGWLQAQLQRWPGGDCESLGWFVTKALTTEATTQELCEFSGFHIGAFEEREGSKVPVFVYARNVDLTPHGYAHLGEFRVDEQFPRDYAPGVPMSQLRMALQQRAESQGLPFWLRNGDLRFFAPIWDGIEQGAAFIVKQPGYRTPNSLDEWERVARSLIVLTSQLYRVLYSRGAPLIGGPVRVIALPWP